MIYVIHFDVSLGQLISMEEFDDADRERAHARRAQLERIARERGDAAEIVTLGADDQDALRRTHGRYFEYIDAGHTTITRYGEVATPPLAVRERPTERAD
jgi:hypothetical protein